MQITYYGHSCFLFETAQGTRVLTDPCDPDTGYTLSNIAADIVTVSHAHHDHSYVAAVSGDPAVVSAAGMQDFEGVRITGYPTFHDEKQGALRGENLMFLFEMDDLRVLHAGDLGHALDDTLIEKLGRVDVLLCPIGGVYTLDAVGAVDVVRALTPGVFIPMHYATPALKFTLGGVGALLKLVKTYRVHRLNSSACSITADSLGEKRVLLLDYKK